MRQDLFFTRFYIFENIYDNKILANILNTIKVDMDSLSNVSAEPDGGPDYRTNYYVHESHIKLFDPIVNILNEHLLKEESAHYQVTSGPWYSEYGEHDGHEPHVHDQTHFHQYYEIGKNCWKLSCIINLSNFGYTKFANPNHTSCEIQHHYEASSYGKVILFPCNLLHWVSPHRYSGRIRASFAMNGLLTLK